MTGLGTGPLATPGSAGLIAPVSGIGLLLTHGPSSPGHASANMPAGYVQAMEVRLSCHSLQAHSQG